MPESAETAREDSISEERARAERFGERCRAVRVLEQLTIQEAAAVCHVNASTLALIEAGEYPCWRDSIASICNGFGVRSEYLAMTEPRTIESMVYNAHVIASASRQTPTPEPRRPFKGIVGAEGFRLVPDGRA